MPSEKIRRVSDAREVIQDIKCRELSEKPRTGSTRGGESRARPLTSGGKTIKQMEAHRLAVDARQSRAVFSTMRAKPNWRRNPASAYNFRRALFDEVA